MSTNLSQFTTSATPLGTEYVVGYSTPVSGGERKWLWNDALKQLPTSVGIGVTPEATRALLVNGNGSFAPTIEAYSDDAATQADITATTFGITGGGIFHGRLANGTRSSPTGVTSGQIVAGYGGRAYTSAGAFQTSSPSSIHFVASEDQTGTNFGSYLRFLTTPKLSTTRQERVIISDTGTLWCHNTGTFDPKDETQSKPIADILTLASSASAGVAMGVFGYGASGLTAGYRGGWARGTAASPSATLTGDMICFMGGHVFNGSAWTTGTKALISFLAAETASLTNQGTYITFNSTPLASTTRAEVMRISSAGNLLVGTTSDTGLTGANGLIVSSSTEATSTTAAAAIFSGGVGIAKKLYVAGVTTLAGTDLSPYALLIKGATKGIRFYSNTGGSIIEGVDNTGTGSFQPLYFGGSSVLFTISGGLAATYSATGLAIVGSVATSAPSGGTSAAWKLGTVSVTSPTSPNRTIELDVGGTIYYLAAKTTNN